MVECIAIIRGIPHIPSVTEVNVRTGPGTAYALAFLMPVGADTVNILDIKPDAEGKAKDGKIYQWFQLTFRNSTVGWVRDDLLDIMGDCVSRGYGNYSQRTFVFPITRAAVPTTPVTTTPVTPAPVAPAPVTPAQVTPTPVAQVAPAPVTPIATAPAPVTPAPNPASPSPAPSAPLDATGLERVRRASFAITQTFEGKGYSAYQNYDTGIVSYGRFQFTLAAGSLGTVAQRYAERSHTPTANELRNNYLQRILGRDAQLRNDARLKELLLAAAEDEIMKRVQNEVATEGYWTRMYTLSAQPRGIGLPLSLALLFDIAINFGVMHGLLTAAEGELGVPQKSKVSENGITEKQLIARVADIRKRGHDKQADRDNLPGLKVRGDFWVGLVASGDWDLAGDANGAIAVKGRPLQVRTPSEF